MCYCLVFDVCWYFSFVQCWKVEGKCFNWLEMRLLWHSLNFSLKLNVLLPQLNLLCCVVLCWVVLCCVVLCWIVAFREVECALANCVFNQPQSNLDCQFEPLPFENYNSLETGNIRNMNTSRIWVLVWNTRSRNCLVWSSVVWNEIFRCYFQWKTFGQIVTLSLTWPPLGCLGLNQLRFYQNLLQQILPMLKHSI